MASLEKIKELLSAFVSETHKATGKGFDRARFFGFKLPKEVEALYNNAVELLAGNRIADAVKEAEGALKALKGKQRSYSSAAVEIFERRLEELDGQLDDDLIEGINKNLDEFKLAVESMRQVMTVMDIDFDLVSKRYWAVNDGISEAKQKQEAREANARMLVRAGRGSSKQQKRVALLEQNEALLAEQAREREARAAEAEQARLNMANMFANAL